MIRLFKAIARWFSKMGTMLDPVWYFRIVVSNGNGKWHIQLTENSLNDWRSISKRTDAFEDAQTMYFESYQAALQYAIGAGIPQAYVQKFTNGAKQSMLVPIPAAPRPISTDVPIHLYSASSSLEVNTAISRAKSSAADAEESARTADRVANGYGNGTRIVHPLPAHRATGSAQTAFSKA